MSENVPGRAKAARRLVSRTRSLAAQGLLRDSVEHAGLVWAHTSLDAGAPDEAARAILESRLSDLEAQGQSFGSLAYRHPSVPEGLSPAQGFHELGDEDAGPDDPETEG